MSPIIIISSIQQVADSAPYLVKLTLMRSIGRLIGSTTSILHFGNVLSIFSSSSSWSSPSIDLYNHPHLVIHHGHHHHYLPHHYNGHDHHPCTRTTSTLLLCFWWCKASSSSSHSLKNFTTWCSSRLLYRAKPFSELPKIELEVKFCFCGEYKVKLKLFSIRVWY